MSATDRELLELAARAAGLRVKFEEVHGCYWIELGQGIPIDVWNPLDHDGDALRLAMATKVIFDMQDHLGSLIFEEGPQPSFEQAVRRAIVRAAAAIAAAQQTQGGGDATD